MNIWIYETMFIWIYEEKTEYMIVGSRQRLANRNGDVEIKLGDKYKTS